MSHTTFNNMSHTTINDGDYTPSSPHDTDAGVRVVIELRLPRHAAGRLADGLIGSDNDALLAAELALRAAIDCDDAQLDLPEGRGVIEALRNEAAIEERCEQLYGPPSDGVAREVRSALANSQGGTLFIEEMYDDGWVCEVTEGQGEEQDRISEPAA